VQATGVSFTVIKAAQSCETGARDVLGVVAKERLLAFRCAGSTCDDCAGLPLDIEYEQA
jgi:hypothetical protein